jgi:hypothetical protein
VGVGSQRAPIREGKGAPKAEAKKEPEKKPSGDETVAKAGTGKAPVPDTEPDRQPEMVVKPGESEGGGSPVMRGIGFSMIGVGVASLAAGTLFGLLAQSTRSDVARRSMMLDSANDIKGITQDMAQGLTQRGNLQALLADVFWGVGGGLLVAGSVIWFFGRDVFVVPGGGGGIGLAGRF